MIRNVYLLLAHPVYRKAGGLVLLGEENSVTELSVWGQDMKHHVIGKPTFYTFPFRGTFRICTTGTVCIPLLKNAKTLGHQSFAGLWVSLPLSLCCYQVAANFLSLEGLIHTC